jgi:hypothetical protein
MTWTSSHKMDMPGLTKDIEAPPRTTLAGTGAVHVGAVHACAHFGADEYHGMHTFCLSAGRRSRTPARSRRSTAA